MTPEAIMIFAAGLGTRMGELTRTRPKPLVEVAGRPLIGHALDLAHGARVPRIVVNTHAHADQMAAWIAANAPEVRISHEPELLETGGGLRQALPLLDSDVAFTLNADMVWRGGNPLFQLAAAWDGSAMDALLCVVRRQDAVGHGGAGDFFLRADGRVSRRGSAAAADYVYTGCQILRTPSLHTFPEGPFSLNRVWDRMLAKGRVFGLSYAGRWVDVGSPEGIALAEGELAS
jgi:N-acetyl-alpha-D-muramate 1-phosphate uridylyltransferase